MSGELVTIHYGGNIVFSAHALMSEKCRNTQYAHYGLVALPCISGQIIIRSYLF